MSKIEMMTRPDQVPLSMECGCGKEHNATLDGAQWLLEELSTQVTPIEALGILMTAAVTVAQCIDPVGTDVRPLLRGLLERVIAEVPETRDVFVRGDTPAEDAALRLAELGRAGEA